MVKIFVSGKFFDKEVISSFMNMFRNMGHVITHDWTKFEGDNPTDEELKIAGENDINGVRNCDIHIIILSDPNYAYRGTFAELGCSLGLGKRVMIFSGPKEGLYMRVPFYHHPLVEHYYDFDKLLANIDKKN